MAKNIINVGRGEILPHLTQRFIVCYLSDKDGEELKIKDFRIVCQLPYDKDVTTFLSINGKEYQNVEVRCEAYYRNENDYSGMPDFKWTSTGGDSEWTATKGFAKITDAVRARLTAEFEEYKKTLTEKDFKEAYKKALYNLSNTCTGGIHLCNVEINKFQTRIQEVAAKLQELG